MFEVGGRIGKSRREVAAEGIEELALQVAWDAEHGSDTRDWQRWRWCFAMATSLLLDAANGRVPVDYSPGALVKMLRHPMDRKPEAAEESKEVVAAKAQVMQQKVMAWAGTHGAKVT